MLRAELALSTAFAVAAAGKAMRARQMRSRCGNRTVVVRRR
jgi:hypothetical protein